MISRPTIYSLKPLHLWPFWYLCIVRAEVGRRRIVALRDELLGGPVGEQRLDFRTVLVQLAFAGAFRPSDR